MKAGVYTALVTPFQKSGELDLKSFKALLENQADAGIAGVIPCGTTGESPTLNIDEKKKLISTALEVLKHSKTTVLAGTGFNDTHETVALSKWASKAGVEGVLVVTPYYNKPSVIGLEAHFQAVAKAVDCEVMLYNVPGRTGVSIPAKSVAKLAHEENITALKEASGSLPILSEIQDQCEKLKSKIDLFSGDDVLFLPSLTLGAIGVVSVASNLFPRQMVAIQAAFARGHYLPALELHQRFYPLFRDLFIESNPGPIKQALSWMGQCLPTLRAPLALMSPENQKRLKLSLKQCGIKKGAKL